MNPSTHALSSFALCGAFSLAPLAALGLILSGPQGGSPPIELDEAQVFVEFNATDEDLGLHLFWDGDDWDRMQVSSPDGDSLLKVRATRGLAEQGLTEGFFESGEPSLSELSLEEFFERFPAGEYVFEGITLDGEKLLGEAQFSHVLPAAPANLFPAHGAAINANLPLVLSFDAVTQDLEGHPLSPELYTVVLETEHDILEVFSVVLHGDVASPAVTVPPEFLAGGTEYKLEVIVQAENGNRTISENVFTTL